MTKDELLLQRRRKGLTQAQLATIVKVSRQSVINWEHGAFRIPADLVPAIIEACQEDVPVKPAKPKPYHTDFYGLYVLRRDQLNEDHAEAWHVCCTDCKLYDRPLPTQEDIAAIIERYPEIINGDQPKGN